MSSVRDNLEVLKKAQEIDRELYLNHQRLKGIPEERLQRKRDMELEKNHLTELENQLKKMQLKQKEKEGGLLQKEDHIKKLDGQLSQVKTNREYSALQQEIASLKADSSLLEEEIIHILDEVEAAQDEVEKEKTRLQQTNQTYESREREIEAQEKTLQETTERLKKQREEIMGQVVPDVRDKYDLVVQRKQGLALVKVNGEVCGACQIRLRPQLLNEIRLGEALIVCENCSRILYFED